MANAYPREEEMTERLWERFADPEYLKVYNESLIDTTVATQIQTMRDQREWTQAALAKRAGMKQSRISEMEDADYSSWTVTTLRRLAAAFGCGLIVRFAPPSEIVDWADRTSADSMRPMDYKTEIKVREIAERASKQLKGAQKDMYPNPPYRMIPGGGGVGQMDLEFRRANLQIVARSQRHEAPLSGNKKWGTDYHPLASGEQEYQDGRRQRT